MSEATQPEAIRPPVPCRKRWRIARLLLGLFLLLLVLFHQPLLREGLRFGFIHLAARENVQLSLSVEGNVWGHLTLKNLRAVSTGVSPVESIAIERLRVEYSLWTLLRVGPGDFITDYNLRNAYLTLDPAKGSEDQKRHLLHALRDTLEQPAMYSDRAQIENFNLTLRTPEGVYLFKDVHALLGPMEHGYIRAGEMVVPNLGAWRGLHTSATYVNRHLVMRNFNLGEEVHVARLELDSSHRAKGIHYLSFEGTVLGGDLGLFLWQRENASGAIQAQLTAYFSDMPLETLGKYTGWKVPVAGNLKQAWVQMSGDPLVPSHWEGHVNAEVAEGVFNGFSLGEVSLKLTLGKGMARLEELRFATGKNQLVFHGERRLPETFEWHDFTGMETAFTLDAPELSSLHAAFTGGAITGNGKLVIQKKTLNVEGNLTASGVKAKEFGIEQGNIAFEVKHNLHLNASGTPWYEGLSGHASVAASDLRFRQFAARRLAFDVPITGDSARIASFALDINGKDKLEGNASITLGSPFAYEGRLAGSVQDIAIFQPFFEIPVAGALDIDWRGAGEIERLRHSGEGRVELRRGRLGEWTGVEAELAGMYSPENIEISTLRLRCDQGTLQAGVRLRDQSLQVEGLRLTAGKSGAVTGSFRLPLDLRTPTRRETIFPASGALAGALVLEQMELAQLLPTSPNALRGSVSGSLALEGTVASPDLTARFALRNLQSSAAEKFAPAIGDASVRFHENRLALSGSVAQPGLSTLEFKGEMPLDLRKTLFERRVDPATPISCSVKLPPSPAGLLASLLPGVRMLDGRLSIDASATGTLEKPVFSGGIALDLPAIRFQSADIPGINHLRADLRFGGTELTFQRCTGDMAGGPFAVAGRLRLEPFADPVLDLLLQSQGTLLVRNDSLTLRADSDLRLTGPFSKTLLSGKIGVTKSRFFREIEILPIGLPGRPVPKSANGGFALTIETPPFRNWTYNIAIRTIEPFSVKGNLANGSIEGDLHLGGTGFAPKLEGVAHIDNFIASLPFSKLNVDRGALYFEGGATLNPSLDIHGSSRIRDYNVNVYLYGTASEPQTLFTSEPSLPQEEVIALLATGATTRDFAQNNQALAGRAAVLLFQDLYHKVFPRRPSKDSSANPMDRFSLNVGGVDPRTGRQELMGNFKLSDQYQLGAGVDMQGDMRMQLQYLIRFR